MASRIQRRRTKGWRAPEGTVYVGRPSRFGNPWRIGETYAWSDTCDTHPEPLLPWVDYQDARVERARDAETVTRWFRSWITTPNHLAHPISLATVHWEIHDALPSLADRDLMCWCPESSPCHADVLLDIANGGRR